MNDEDYTPEEIKVWEEWAEANRPSEISQRIINNNDPLI